MHSYALIVCGYHAYVNDALSTEYVHRELGERSQDVFVLVQSPYGQKIHPTSQHHISKRTNSLLIPCS